MDKYDKLRWIVLEYHDLLRGTENIFEEGKMEGFSKILHEMDVLDMEESKSFGLENK
jgi:hypothetical protein